MEGTKTWVYYSLYNVPYDMCACHKEECDTPVVSRCGVKLVVGAVGAETVFNGASVTPYTCA